jgi:hypothetical protein
MVCSTVPQGHAASMDLQDSIAKDLNEFRLHAKCLLANEIESLKD